MCSLVVLMEFVPGYSDGPAPVLHRIPFYLMGTLNNQFFARLLCAVKDLPSESQKYMPAVNFLLCLEDERNTRLLKIPL